MNRNVPNGVVEADGRQGQPQPPLASLGAASAMRRAGVEDAGYTSVDPAPPLDGKAADHRARVAELRARLTDTGLPMFQRMRCVFTLRNLGGPAAVDALAACFADPSALLRHEVAYVLGQMQDAHAIPALTRTLMREDEHVMVRHECAEALGAIGRPESVPVLEHYARDPHPEVAESCVVALDLIAWVNSKELEYADA